MLVLKTDITSKTEVDELFAKAEEKFGAFDYVVNCAGMMDK
jgi:NAD(P)-dependent dehydrogenase (short-subunit alcohol dehydrogenase family)